jgi:hypothetical protein
MVEGDGFGELRNIGRRAAGEPSATGDWRNFFHLLEFKLQLVRTRQAKA